MTSPTREPMTYLDAVSDLCASPDWSLIQGRLVRVVDCGSWAAAWSMLGRVAEVADRLDHHPDWSQRGGILRFEVTTHRPRGISRLDLALVAAIDAELAKASA